MRRIGIDAGGTFTDFLLLEDGKVRAVKVPSTPDDPSRAVLEGLERLGGADAELVHGSTVGTNAVLERRGSRTGLVTTRGFGDVLEIGRQARPRLYELEPRREPSLIPRDLRLELEERVDASGNVLQRIDPARLEAIVARLRELGVESVAVGLIHAYRNPEHELQVAEALAGCGVPVSLSHQVLGEYREYERFVATAVNAYIRPVMEAYLDRLTDSVGGRLRVMRSNGGSLSAAAASREPVQTLLSGPAAGVVGAAFLGRLTGEERVITLDMGGTSTDVSLLDGGPRLATELTLGDLPLRIPMLDIHTVGAGGGSIAWRDKGGALRVGPRSAGADPGPACYGRGDAVTVTDANLVLGRLLPDRFLGGEVALDADRAHRMMERFASTLGLSPGRAAAGIQEVAQATMEKAIRVISLERGEDPSRFVLYCYGGAGGLHVAALARGLGIPRIRIPAHPGLFSALGMLASDVVLDLSETVLLGASEASRAAMEAVFGRLESAARAALAREGFGADQVDLVRRADLRYRGQSFELQVDDGPDMVEAFHRLHELRHGHSAPGRPVEVVHLRLRAIGRVRPPELVPVEAGGEDPSPARLQTRTVLLDGGAEADVPVYDRERLRAGMAFEGPGLVVEYSSTVWVPPGGRIRMDHWGSLVMEVEG